MREYRVPAVVSVGDQENLADAVFANAAEYPDAVVYRRRDAAGRWTDVSASAFAGEVTRVAAGLIAAGVQAGDRVAVLSRTRYEWSLVDYAILAAGAVTVPIYETFPGWSEDISQARSFEELPANAQAYVRALEAMSGAQISVIGVGPAREQTVVVHPLI